MATTNFVLIPPTGIIAAIEDHRSAWSTYQNVTEDSEADELAFIELHEALDRLVGTPCRNMDETRALAAHLFWYVNAERHTRDWTSSPDSGALARAADLALLLRDDPATIACDPPHLTLGQFVARVVQRVALASSIVSIERRTPDFRLAEAPEPSEPWCFVTPVRPDTPHVRALRVIDTLGEAFAGLVLIVGGAIATGIATLL